MRDQVKTYCVSRGFKSRPVRGRILGSAFLLGGGFGLYQTVKLQFQHHLAAEKIKVNAQSFAIKRIIIFS